MSLTSRAQGKNSLRRLVILAVLVLPAAHVWSQDVEVSPPPSPEHPVVDVFFTDQRNGWILTAKEGMPFLFRTSDGGDSWRKIQLQVPLQRVFFLNSYEGWGFSAKDSKRKPSELFHSADGGDTWAHVTSLQKPGARGETALQDLFFTDPKHGILVAHESRGQGVVLRTTNGGRTFEKVAAPSDSPYPLSKIVSDCSKILWILGTDTIIRSQNNGASWEVQMSRSMLPEGYKCNTLNCIHLYAGDLAQDRHLWAVGHGRGGTAGFLLSSTDLGQTWSVAVEDRMEEDSLLGGTFYDISFGNDSWGCAVGSTIHALCTGDGGTTWHKQRLMPALPLEKEMKDPRVKSVFRLIHLLPTGHGWLVTNGGYLYQTDDWGETWQELDLAQAAEQR